MADLTPNERAAYSRIMNRMVAESYAQLRGRKRFIVDRALLDTRPPFPVMTDRSLRPDEAWFGGVHIVNIGDPDPS